MSLIKMTGGVELIATIGGEKYSFSELPIEALGRLQNWITKHTPHPVDALRGHLDGLPAHVAIEIAERARQEARDWPPQLGTAAGAAALLHSENGQKEALREGLKVHHPELLESDVQRIYRAMRADAGREARAAKKAGREYDGEGVAKRIFGVLFGLEEDDPDTTLPKA